MKHPDIYMDQTDNRGRAWSLRRRTHEGAVWYYCQPIYLEVEGPIDPATQKPRKRQPRNLREARRARREYIARMESEGRTVKGVRFIEPELVHSLGIRRFKTTDQIKDIEGVADALKGRWFVALLDHSIYREGMIFGPSDFEDLAIGRINYALLHGKIYRAEPLEDAEEI